jgi:signal transduction histidine kinase
MASPESGKRERRVLVLPPTPRDGAFTQAVLAEAGNLSTLCGTLEELCREMEAGVGAILLTEESIAPERVGCLVDALRGQPAWSDPPVLVLTRGGWETLTAAGALETLGSVTLLDRPVRIPVLVSAVRSALRARERQYEIRDLLAELREREEALREADRRKDEFLAMLAHELRNPLAPIRNAVELFRLAGPVEPRLQRANEIIARQVGHMTRLIDDLLDVSRITRGKIQLRRELIDLGSIVAAAIETARPLIEARRHELTVSLPSGPLFLEGDPTRLSQVFANLLQNGAKFTEPQGHLWLTAEKEGDTVVVRVRDTGIGIAPEILPHVFDLFSQGERALDRSQGGLGIGLSLVRGLVQLHGGSVQAISPGVGGGSEFIVRLPLIPETPSLAVPADRAPRATISPRRILVVDDNVDAAESLADLLQAGGHEVRTAYNGPSCLELAVNYQPEVVLLDIGLPGMDGYEVARRLRQIPPLADVTLVALTGYGQKEDVARAKAAGFDSHMVKPVDADPLFGLLEGGDDALA